MTELSSAELGERILQEALIARPDAWSSRADIVYEVLEWAEFEEVTISATPRIFRALRLAGVTEAKRMGVRGFHVAIRDADWTPEAQLDRFLRRGDLVKLTDAGWTTMTGLYGLYRIWARNSNEEPMSSRKFASLMASEGFSRRRKADPSRKSVQRRTQYGFVQVKPTAWGWDGIAFAEDPGGLAGSED